MENWCQDCQSEGKDVVGKFKVDDRWKCAAHYMAWRKDHPEEKPKPVSFDPPVREPEPEPMKDKPDYAAMQKDRDLGMRPIDIAKKYKCTYQTVFNRTSKPTVPVVKKRTERLEALTGPAIERQAFIKRPKADAAFPGNSSISELLAKLKARREALSQAILAVETAQKLLAREEELA